MKKIALHKAMNTKDCQQFYYKNNNENFDRRLFTLQPQNEYHEKNSHTINLYMRYAFICIGTTRILPSGFDDTV